MAWSMSLFVLYFGTDRTYSGHVAHHTVDLRSEVPRLLDDIFHGSHVPDDFSLYLHAPTVTDPSLAPDGCGTFYVLAPVPHLGQRPVDWDAPLPRTRTGFWRLSSTSAGSAAARRDAALDDAPALPRRAALRITARRSRARPIAAAERLVPPAQSRSAHPGLYLVGAGTHPGAGVPGVVNSAKATASVIAQDYGA
jgi:phytoene desaturase